MNNNIPIKNFHHVAFRCRDAEQTRWFYEDILGLKLAAAMSFDTNIDELTIASALHEKVYGKPLELITLPNGLQVPASAESDMYFGELGVLCSGTVSISTPDAGSVTLFVG